jgi:gas vesicle protein
MIIRLLPLAIGLAIGYVLGTKDGTTRLDALRAKLSPIIDDPRVVRARKDVQTYARQQAPVIRERAETAVKDAADKTADVAKDVAGKVQTTAKDVAGKTADVAKDVAGKVTETAADVRDQVTKTAADLRERGEDLIDRTLQTAGSARDAALDVFDDEDDAPTGTAAKPTPKK